MKQPKKKRLLSLSEANALLPELETRLRRLQNKKESYSRMHDALFMHELVCAAEKNNGFSETQDDLEAGIHALEGAIEELAADVEAIFALGGILRNIERGQVDFLGALDGQTVFFSWELGEPAIRYFHDLGKKFHERIELPPEVSG